jgi:hypothetical protein
MTRPSVRQRILTTALLAGIALASASCGEVATTGRAPVILIVDSLTASIGEETEFSGFLLSDVETKGSAVNDNGRAVFRIALKNPGNVASPLAPSTLNEVTLNRYDVRYIRSDGRAVEGVDVPYGFSGGVTATINTTNGGEAVFLLVRHSAKREPPLRNLIGGGGRQIMTMIAQVTFYGRDQAGNDVSAVGNITVTFADFGDPE